MRKLLVLGSLMALLVPAAPEAQASLGFRVGYASPGGDAFQYPDYDPYYGYYTATYKMSDGLSSSIPLQAELGFGVSPQLSVGGYLSYAFGQVGGEIKNECDFYSLDCSARSVRFGLQAIFSIVTSQPNFIPWVGGGLGYEWSGLKESGYGSTYELKADGPEVNLQVGGDFALNPQVSAGPYLMLSIGRYTNVEVSETGWGSRSVPIDETVHEWFSLGLRGKFDL